MRNQYEISHKHSPQNNLKRKSMKNKEREMQKKFIKTDDELRFDNVGHLIQVIEKRRRWHQNAPQLFRLNAANVTLG